MLQSQTHRRRAIALIAALGLAVAACGGDDSSSATDAPGTDAPDATTHRRTDAPDATSAHRRTRCHRGTLG